MVSNLNEIEGIGAKKGGRFSYSWKMLKANVKIEICASIVVFIYFSILVILNPSMHAYIGLFELFTLIALLSVMLVLIAFYLYRLNIGDSMITIQIKDVIEDHKHPAVYLRIWKNDEKCLVTFLLTGRISDNEMNPYKKALQSTAKAADDAGKKSYRIDFLGQVRSTEGRIIRAESVADSPYTRKELFRPFIFLFSGVVSLILLGLSSVAGVYVNGSSNFRDNENLGVINLMLAAMLVMGILSWCCSRWEERSWFLMGQNPEFRTRYFEATKEIRDYQVSLLVGLFSITLIVVFYFSPISEGELSPDSSNVISKIISAIVLLLTISSIGKVLGSAKHSFEKAMWDKSIVSHRR